MEVENIVGSENVTSEMEYELMDTNETSLDGLAEEGEISSSEDEFQAHKKTETQGSIFTNFRGNYNKNQSGGFVTGFNIFDKDEAAKKVDRAKRFSIQIDKGNNPQIQLEELANLHRELGIDKDSEKHYRFNAIHMRGTDDMSTEDVFQYFEHFAPSHVQWINDKTCNVVWLDEISTARALLQLSKRIRNLDKIHLNANPFEKELNDMKETEEEMNDNEDDDESVDARKIQTAIPPGYWRLGVPAPKSSCILLRYATRCDKKQQNAEKNSEYYKKYGNPHYGNKPGIFTNSLRFKKFNFKKPSNKWKNRLDNVIDKKNPWKDLAYRWGKAEKEELDPINETDYSFNKRKEPSEVNNRSNYVPDLRLSLENKKEVRKRKQYRDSETRTEQAWRAKMRVPRMKMHADDEEQKLSNYLVNNAVVDLRKKISAKKNRRNKFLKEREMKTDDPESDCNNSENEYEEIDDYEGKKRFSEYKHQNKRQNLDSQSVSVKEESESEDDRYGKDSNKDINRMEDRYKINLGHISPLRIEIDNDEYYPKK